MGKRKASSSDSTAPLKRAKPAKKKSKFSAKENTPAKKSLSKKESGPKTKAIASTKPDTSSTGNEAQQAKENELKKANIHPFPESAPINPLAPVKDKPQRRRRKTENDNNDSDPSKGTSQAPSAIPLHLVPPGTEPRLHSASDGSRFGLHVGMSPTLERLKSKEFFSSNPPQDPPFWTRPFEVPITHPPMDLQKADAASNHDSHAKNVNPSTPNPWPKNLDPKLMSSSPSLHQRPRPSQPQPGPSQPGLPAGQSSVHWGLLTTYILNKDFSSDSDEPKRTSEHKGACDDNSLFHGTNGGNTARASDGVFFSTTRTATKSCLHTSNSI
ncbi:hypothetical protein PILCRDRAFT_4617 [Piloderma croceum F 1598]|uniref:Uncharacterized protein n=1 Tax=Piloderma croceum (strain F 1598) TaxID=765440 RepID=A0A0C3BK38_PILCF|nr:hypothetical protein PILCRDRAFT_4617 [Piloderma croceum F 1598]